MAEAKQCAWAYSTEDFVYVTYSKEVTSSTEHSDGSDWLHISGDGLPRCWWCGDDPLYVAYHDNEWGRKVTDDQRLFEKICLEGFQAGLSWITILRRRETFREAFAHFDFRKVAQFSKNDVDALLQNSGIIRHRGKIEATINNAQRCCELIESQGSLSNYIWSFVNSEKDQVVGNAHPSGIPAMTEISTRLSKDLKKRGFRFVGPTTMYAFMQSVGMVNDHVRGCHIREECM